MCVNYTYRLIPTYLPFASFYDGFKNALIASNKYMSGSGVG